MLPAVSVVITVKNEAASIETLLHSLGRQTHPPDEIVIVDGGSTDGTLGIIEAAGPPMRGSRRQAQTSPRDATLPSAQLDTTSFLSRTLGSRYPTPG